MALRTLKWSLLFMNKFNVILDSLLLAEFHMANGTLSQFQTQMKTSFLKLRTILANFTENLNYLVNLHVSGVT